MKLKHNRRFFSFGIRAGGKLMFISLDNPHQTKKNIFYFFHLVTYIPRLVCAVNLELLRFSTKMNTKNNNIMHIHLPLLNMRTIRRQGIACECEWEEKRLQNTDFPYA